MNNALAVLIPEYVVNARPVCAANCARFLAQWGPVGDHWQSALSSAEVLPRPGLVAGRGVPKWFWSVNDG